ncbi:unnamed protein product [Vicia faba]|uniref:Aminotransferase-like plant mobile domain-containing protein n=1 Tax=Vicia faba TaxID=3906 RepID=A0AAV0ZQG4_VICFA|nr:unnamed protein product [Vicia faba]
MYAEVGRQDEVNKVWKLMKSMVAKKNLGCRLVQVGNQIKYRSRFCLQYREMCTSVDIKVTEMSGCVLLLQVWAFTRMPIISLVTPLQTPYPYARRWCIKKLDYQNNSRHHLQGYRFRIDHMLQDQFIWRPYLGLASQRHEDNLIWSSTTYIICFHIVEMHQEDRVKLQLGHLQGYLKNFDAWLNTIR